MGHGFESSKEFKACLATLKHKTINLNIAIKDGNIHHPNYATVHHHSPFTFKWYNYYSSLAMHIYYYRVTMWITYWESTISYSVIHLLTY